MCGCDKHREAAARVAEEKGYPEVARVIRRIPTHDERMAWLKRTVAQSDRPLRVSVRQTNNTKEA